jgi:hypothetical protein
MQQVRSGASARLRGARRATFLIAASALVAVLAGCGSSSSSSSSSTSSATTSATSAASSSSAAAPVTKTVPGTPAPSGAVTPKQAGLAKLAAVALPHQTAHIVGLDNAPITTAIPLVSTDLNKFWSTEFANSGVQWPTVQDVLVSNAPVQSQACSVTVNPTDEMQLCYDGTTATFYWTVPWMQQNLDTDPGGVNLSLGMSAAYSNAVLDLTGYYDQLKAGQITEAQWEQQNLCLTGIYARSLDERSLLEKADIPTLQNFYNALSGDSQGATAQQMQSAFAAGFNSGSPATCLPQTTSTTSTSATTSALSSSTSTAALPTSSSSTT